MRMLNDQLNQCVQFPSTCSATYVCMYGHARVRIYNIACNTRTLSLKSHLKYTHACLLKAYTADMPRSSCSIYASARCRAVLYLSRVFLICAKLPISCRKRARLCEHVGASLRRACVRLACIIYAHAQPGFGPK